MSALARTDVSSEFSSVRTTTSVSAAVFSGLGATFPKQAPALVCLGAEFFRLRDF